MTNEPDLSISTLHDSVRKTAFAVATLIGLALIAAQTSQAQTFTVLHNFTGGADGANPFGSLTMDRGENRLEPPRVGVTPATIAARQDAAQSSN